MTREEKQNIFKPLTSNFETKEFIDYYMDMVAEMPDYIFTMPSSTSGKYHNKTQCETYGQIYHEYMFDLILNHRLRLKGNKEKFNTPEIRDCMRCVPTFHDAVKCGWNGSSYTVQDHPILAAEWVRSTNPEHNISEEHKELIACMCEAHSGEWNKSKVGKEIMPEPRNEMEFFIHECDILSSRNDIDMIIPEGLKGILGSVKVELPNIEEYPLPFGKYKGRLITEIAKEHKDYLEWMNGNLNLKEPLKTFVSTLLS